MANITNAEEARLLDDSLTTVFLGIFDNATATDGDLEAGTVTSEVTSYTGDRKAMTFAAGSQVTGKYTRSTSAAIEFEDMPAVTISHFGVFSAATGGTLRWWGQLDVNRTTASGDTLRFPVGDITIDLD
jgi:hypothetical protein